MPADARPRARLARRRRGVPARPGAADANGRLRAAEPLRGLPRGAVRAGQAWLRAVAADEVPVVRRARRARVRDARGPPRQEPAGRARDGAQLLDPLCRAELERREDDPLLRHLAEAGPSELDDLQLELGLSPRELKRLRTPLERCGAVVARSVVYEDPHRHTSELARWDQRFPKPADAGGLTELVVAGVGRRSSRRSASCRAGSRGGRTAWSSAWSRGPAGAARGGLAGGAVIRELRLEDAAAVARLELALNPHQVLTPEVVWHPRPGRSSGSSLRSWVAEDDGEVVGFACELRVVGADAGQGPLLDRRPSREQRARGIGGELYAHVSEYLRARGAWRLRTWVDDDPDGTRFLERRGFEPRRRRPRLGARARGRRRAGAARAREFGSCRCARRATGRARPLRDLRGRRDRHARRRARDGALARGLAPGRLRLAGALGRGQLRRARRRAGGLARVPDRRPGAPARVQPDDRDAAGLTAAAVSRWPRRPRQHAGRAATASSGS